MDRKRILPATRVRRPADAALRRYRIEACERPRFPIWSPLPCSSRQARPASGRRPPGSTSWPGRCWPSARTDWKSPSITTTWRGSCRRWPCRSRWRTRQW